MTDQRLTKKINQLDSQFRTELEEIQRQHLITQNKIGTIQQQLLDLQRQLDQLRARKLELEERRQETSERFSREIFEMVRSALESDRQGLIQRWENIREKQQLQDKRDEWFSENSDRKEEWASYLEFEANKESILADLPQLHRKMIREEQEQLKLRLQPIIEITQRLEEIDKAISEEITVAIFLYHNADTGDISLTLPQHHDDEQNDFQKHWAQFTEALGRVFFQLAFSQHISVLKLDWGKWDRFLTYDALAEYDDDDLLPSLEELLGHQFKQEAFWDSIQIELIAIAEDVWERGRKAATMDLVEEKLEPAESDKTSRPSSQKLVVGKGWYATEDVVSWRRPVKSTSATGWNKNARMIRTLFIRMIAKGYVGDNFVDQEHLWQGLPSSEAERIHSFTEKFIEQGVFQVTNLENATRVSINPEHLEDVQTIINRSVDEFWAELL